MSGYIITWEDPTKDRGNTLASDDVATQALADLIRAAQQQYPGKAGKTELHHIVPKYLGGDPKGDLEELNAAYHQLITNAFRSGAPYGGPTLSKDDLQELIQAVYERYPLPSGRGTSIA